MPPSSPPLGTLLLFTFFPRMRSIRPCRRRAHVNAVPPSILGSAPNAPFLGTTSPAEGSVRAGARGLGRHRRCCGCSAALLAALLPCKKMKSQLRPRLPPPLSALSRYPAGAGRHTKTARHDGGRERAIFSALRRPQPGTIEGRARCAAPALPLAPGAAPVLCFYFQDENSGAEKQPPGAKRFGSRQAKGRTWFLVLRAS